MDSRGQTWKMGGETAPVPGVRLRAGQRSVVLDIFTLLVVLGGVTVVTAGLLGLLYVLHPGVPGPREWVAGKVLISAGVFLIVSRESLPPVLGVLVANGALLVGATCLLAGQLRFVGRQVPWRRLSLVPLLFGLPFLVLFDDESWLGLRVGLQDIGLGVILVANGWTLLTGTRPVTMARRIAAVCFAAFGVMLLSHVANVFRLGPADIGNLEHLGTPLAALVAWSIVQSIITTGCLTIMVTERLRDDLRARVHDLIDARRTVEHILREQRNFLAMVSHEFRTPLSIIDASAMVIEGGLPPGDDDLADEVVRIRRNTARMAGLVDTCVADDWLVSATMERHRRAVDLMPLLTGLADEFAVRLEWDGAAPLPVWANPCLLPVVFTSLLDNARKYGRTAEGAWMSCRLGTDGGGRPRAVVEVGDDGPGIPEAERDRLFEKYYRMQRTLRTPGTGLGLYTARRIVDLHGGNIEIDRKGGAVFRVSLPVVQGESVV